MNDQINAAVREQMNRIKSAALVAEDSDGLQRAADMLGLVAPLWEVVGHGWRTAGTRAYIGERAADLIRTNQEFLRGERRNSRAASSTRADMERCRDFLTPLTV